MGSIMTVDNAFCPTGKGGGVDPSCSPGKTQYHGTLASNLDSILREGIKSSAQKRFSESSQGNRGSKVFATESLAAAQWYGQNAALFSAPGSKFIVFEIEVPEGEKATRDTSSVDSWMFDKIPPLWIKSYEIDGVKSVVTNKRLRTLFVPVVVEFDATTNSSPFPVPPGIQVLKTNAFCPTGKGGGVDPTCSPGKGGSVNEKKFYLSAVVKFGHKKSSQAVNSLVTLRISPRPVEISDKDVSVLKSFGMEFDKIESDFYHIKDTPTNRSIVEAANQIFNYINGDSEFGPAAVKRQAEALSKRAEQWSKGTDDPGLSLTWAITQSAIKKSHVELYRGLAMKDSTTHKRIDKASLKSVKVSNVGHWTTDRRIASQFAESYASTKRSNPLVLSVKVPKKDILFSFHQFGTAGGLAREKEHVPVLKNTNLKVSSQKIRTDVWDVSYASVELSYGR